MELPQKRRDATPEVSAYASTYIMHTPVSLFCVCVCVGETVPGGPGEVGQATGWPRKGMFACIFIYIHHMCMFATGFFQGLLGKTASKGSAPRTTLQKVLRLGKEGETASRQGACTHARTNTTQHNITARTHLF